MTDQSYEITLITGDVVTVRHTADGASVTDIEAAPRPDMDEVVTFERMRTPEGDLYVTPSDVHGVWTEDSVFDPDLFNVTYLVEHGYSDEQRARLPLILQYDDRVRAAAQARRAKDLPASTTTHALESIDGASLSVNKANAEAFWASLRGQRDAAAATTTLAAGVTKVWLDRKVDVDLNESVPQIGAPEAWAAGYDGTGVKVAVLDTGIDETHPDVADKVVASQSFVPDQTVVDGFGHGTHVAATIAGTGAAQDGTYKGVAPGADLIVGKVCNDGGGCDSSWVIAGMQWAAQSQGADIISMSLGGCCTDGSDPMSQAVNNLTAQTGALFVIAAGNDGPSRETIGAPGTADAALTVAAVDKSDQLADFSSRGPRWGDGALKPDIAAPGVAIVAARAAGTSMGTPVNNLYTRANGTSMATPHVAGAAAILAQSHPGWDQDELKSVLTGSAESAGEVNPYQVGSGRVDVANAIEQSLLATPSNLDFGGIPDGSAPPTRTITISNHADSPQTVTLSTQVRDPDGNSIGDAVALSPSTLTIPAGGSADVTATFDAGDGPNGTYGGLVRALDAAGTELLRVAVGAEQQPPMHTVTLRNLPPDFARPQARCLSCPAIWHLTRVDAPQDRIDFSVEPADAISVQVPEGVYWIGLDYNWYSHTQTGDYAHVYVDEPEFVVDRDRELLLDANDTLPVTIVTPRPSEPSSAVLLRLRGTSFGGEWSLGQSTGTHGRYFMNPPQPVTTGTFRLALGYGMMEPLFSMRLLGERPIKVHTLYHDYSVGPRAVLNRTVQLVDVGSGSAEEIERANVRGRIALYSYDWREDPENWNVCQDSYNKQDVERPWQRLKEAGAIAAVAFLDVDGEVRMPLCYGTRLPLPVVTVGPVEGNMLRDRASRGPVRVDVRAIANPSYTYKLRFDVDGANGVRDNLTFSARERDLTPVESIYHAATPATAEVNWNSIGPDGTEVLTWFRTQAPAQTTDYFLTRPDMTWLGRGSLLDEDGGLLIRERVRLEDVTTVSTQQWFAAPQVPAGVARTWTGHGLEARPCVACRQGDVFYPIMGLTTPEQTHEIFKAPGLEYGLFGTIDGVEEWHLFDAETGQEILPRHIEQEESR